MDKEMKKLAIVRNHMTELKKEKDNLEAKISATEDAKRLTATKEEIKKLESDEGTLMLDIYSMAVDAYDESNGENVQPHPHVKVQNGTVCIYNADDMVEWAKRENQWHLLNVTLRKRDLEKFARSGWPIPGLRVEETPVARIDSDLSDLLVLDN